jgi:hypothetical protein
MTTAPRRSWPRRPLLIAQFVQPAARRESSRQMQERLTIRAQRSTSQPYERLRDANRACSRSLQPELSRAHPPCTRTPAEVPHSSCSGGQSLAAAGHTRNSSASLPILRATPVPSTVAGGNGHRLVTYTGARGLDGECRPATRHVVRPAHHSRRRYDQRRAPRRSHDPRRPAAGPPAVQPRSPPAGRPGGHR